MARSPQNQTIFPPIPIGQRNTTTYDDSFQGVRTYRGQPLLVNEPKLVELENRLDAQEKTTQQLLDRAMKIKQDLMESLSYTKGTWQEEKEARELLQEHVRTITAVVRQMNKEIKTFVNEVKEKENSISETGNAVKTLESHHVAGITDLRGRVARCDAAIGKLASDLKQAGEAIRNTAGNQADSIAKLNEKILATDTKINDAFNRLEKISSDNHIHVKTAEDNLHRHIHELDSRTQQIVDELRHHINNASCGTATDMERTEARINASIDMAMNARDVRIEKIDSEHHEFAKNVEERLTGYEKDHVQFKAHVAKIHKDFEHRLNQYSESIYQQQLAEIKQVKREMREGFTTVHDTISNMKSVLEGKQKLMEENLRREMAQIRKMVVLV